MDELERRVLVRYEIERRKAAEDINVFIEHVIRDHDGLPIKQSLFDIALQKHIELCRKSGLHAAIAAPFGIGKTVQVVSWLLFHLGNDPGALIKIVGNDADSAKDRVQMLKTYIADDPLLSELYGSIFRDIRPWGNKKWAQKSFTLERPGGGAIDPTAQAGGIESKAISRRATDILFDDICDPSNSALVSAEVREKLFVTAQQAWLSRLGKGGFCLMVFTPWHDRDASMRLIHLKRFCTLRLALVWDDQNKNDYPINRRIEVTAFHAPSGYDLEIEGLEKVNTFCGYADPEGSGWPDEVGAYLGSIPLPARYNFEERYDDMGGSRIAELRMGLIPFAEEERIITHLEDATLRAEPPGPNDQLPIGGAVGMDPATDKREGNAVVGISYMPELRAYVPTDVRIGKWPLPEFLDICERVCERLGGPLPRGPTPVFETNATQSGMFQLFREVELIERYPALHHAVSFITGSEKRDPVVGLQGIDTLMETGVLKIYRPPHRGGCKCGFCKLYNDLLDFQRNQLGHGKTPDSIMALWFAISRIMQGRMQDGLIGMSFYESPSRDFEDHHDGADPISIFDDDDEEEEHGRYF